MMKIVKQFISFGFVGAINTVLNLVIYWVSINMLQLHYLIANAIGFIITVAISYVLNNVITFRENSALDGEEKSKIDWSLLTLLKVYASYFMTGILINSALLWFWNDLIGINENVSPILNLFVTIPLNFLLNKFWAYRKSGTKDSFD